MTILNWKLDRERAVVITDSMITEGSRPAGFGPKALILPHLRSVLTSKGVVTPVQSLWANMMTAAGASGVEDVAQAAPGLLQSAYAAARPQIDEDECCVYLFGWSDQEGRVAGYAFAWENGFVAHRLTDGELLIPPAPNSPGSRDWARTLLMQQAEDRQLPPDDRDNIGGHVIAHSVIAHPLLGAQILVERFPTLPHHAADLMAMPPPPTPHRRKPDLTEWERCSHWIANALDTDNGERSLADLQRGYEQGRYTLFPGRGSAALAEVVQSSNRSHLHLYLAAGELTEIRNELLPRIETFGYRLGCAAIVITGRKGWARALCGSGYQLVWEIDRRRNWWLVAKSLNAASAVSGFEIAA